MSALARTLPRLAKTALVYRRFSLFAALHSPPSATATYFMLFSSKYREKNCIAILLADKRLIAE